MTTRLLVSLIWFLLGTGIACADQVPIHLYTICCNYEPAPPTGPDLTSIDRFLVEQAPSLAIDARYVNRARAWMNIQTRQNACTTRSRKTPEREAIAYFSAMPHSIYPPFRLIMLRGSDLVDASGPIDLAAVLPDLPARIGIVDLVDYGAIINDLIERFPEKFFSVPSQAVSDEQLLLALDVGRIGAFIGDTLTTTDRLDRLRAREAIKLSRSSISVQPIKGIKANLGYLACSKTPEGREIMDAIDDALARPPVQAAIMGVYENAFPAAERAFLRDAFERAFGHTP